MVKNEAATPLINEKRELMLKLEKHKYEKEAERQKDLERIAVLEKEILATAKEHLTKMMSGFKQEDVPKTFTIKDLKKMMRVKYAHYKHAAIEAREFYATAVEKKKEGKTIEQLMKKGMSDELIDEVLKY